MQYEKFGTTELWFFYDPDGTPSGARYKNGSTTTDYYFVCNWRGDVVKIYNSTGALVANYDYDAWGKVVSVTDANGNTITDNNHIANVNPIRYRRYYYDSETKLYYINARYYDPETKRLLNSDNTSLLAVQNDLYDKNLFSYCDNNPVVRIDSDGEFWDTVFDVISLVDSVVNVVKNPSDPMAWVGLTADTVCLAVPVLTGGGAAVKAVSKADNVVDTVKGINKSVNKIDNAVDTTKKVKKVTKVHGNSLKSTKTNYGYALVDKNKNIMKFGETVNPKTRYSKKYLNRHGYSMLILEKGSKIDIHYWQYDMNNYYFHKYNRYPPLIKSRRGW